MKNARTTWPYSICNSKSRRESCQPQPLKTAKGLQTSINTFMTALLSSLRTCNRRVLMDL
nr:MAG TPA: hypothetical protein [Caudoviricetes sp.]